MDRTVADTLLLLTGIPVRVVSLLQLAGSLVASLKCKPRNITNYFWANWDEFRSCLSHSNASNTRAKIFISTGSVLEKLLSPAAWIWLESHSGFRNVYVIVLHCVSEFFSLLFVSLSLHPLYVSKTLENIYSLESHQTVKSLHPATWYRIPCNNHLNKYMEI